MKVVRGLGNLDECESQVKSLQEEYRVVTRLGNHPRIIQFFAIIPDDRNVQIMIVMEYMEGGSLADKLRDGKSIPENSTINYLTQILDGVSFLHRREIFHSDMKPANILFTAEDNLEISDFGIAAGNQLQTKSSATSSNFQGDLRYMSPERLKGDSRSAANDIWSVGATLVHMISGQPLNHLDNNAQLINNISHYNIFIKGNPLNNYLTTLNDSDFKKKVISRTLCKEPIRANGQQLLRILFPHSKRLPAEALMAAGDKKNSDIYGMSYNSARDELFLEDRNNGVVRAMRVRDNAGDLRDVYKSNLLDNSPYIYSVCHMSDSDTLLVCSGDKGADSDNWLVAMSRNGSEWREAQRVQTRGMGWISCALSDSRVLIGNSTYMELFRVESSQSIAPPVRFMKELFRIKSSLRIASVHHVNVPERFDWFSATSGSDTLVAMCYRAKNQVSVHRLRGDRLEELARIRLECPDRLLWLSDRLLVADIDRESSHTPS